MRILSVLIEVRSNTISTYYFNIATTTESYTFCHTRARHDALPISLAVPVTLATSKLAGSGVFVSPAIWINAPAPWASLANALSSARLPAIHRSEEHTSELQSLMRNSYAVFCLKKKRQQTETQNFLQRY